MPMGLTNAPATFQAVINGVLHEFLDVFVLVYLDDVLVYTKETEADHQEKVLKVLEKLAENKLLLHPKKCEFYVTQTKYLGYIISNEGIEIDL